jgi:ubiquinone/menaquinone biosynthesis C-methylase UbiE
MSIDGKVYHSQFDKSGAQALHYSKTHESTHRYLAYRDVPAILKKHFQGKKALDYGTGTGYSAHFLQELGFEVTGVDVSKEMLHQAQLNYPNIPFYLIENKIIPKKSSVYNLVFSSFVLFEIGAQQEIIDYLLEAKRVMKKNGLFVAVTGSQDLHSDSRNWLSFRTDFQQNKNLVSGNLVKLHLYDSDIEFTDYYWTETDYRNFFSKAGFELIDVHYPLGDKNEPHLWKDEISISPFVILIAKVK